MEVICNFIIWGLVALCVEAVPTFWYTALLPWSGGMKQEENVACYIGLTLGIRMGMWSVVLFAEGRAMWLTNWGMAQSESHYAQQSVIQPVLWSSSIRAHDQLLEWKFSNVASYNLWSLTLMIEGIASATR